MLRYLKVYFYFFILIFVFLLGISFYSYFLAKFFALTNLQQHFEIEHLAYVGVILSVILSYLNIKVCRWYFKRLKMQEE